MKFLKNHSGTVLLCVFEALAGVLLLIDPVRFTSAIIRVFGAVLLFIGILSVVRYFRTEAAAAAIGGLLTRGLISLFAAVFCLFFTDIIIKAFSLLTALYGIAVLAAGIVKTEWTVDLLRIKNGRWFMPAIGAAVSFACAAVILCNPFGVTAALWRFTGAALLVEAALDVAALIIVGREYHE